MVDLLISGPDGKIESNYHHNNDKISPIALILHPEPSRGGTMNTKIVHYLYKIFIQKGFSTIKFNFRGVGKSDGIFDEGEGELSDAASVLDWLEQYNTNSPICWVARFLFWFLGSHATPYAKTRNKWICICASPPANNRDFNFLTPCPSSGLIIHGDKDTIASFESTTYFIRKTSTTKKS